MIENDYLNLCKRILNNGTDVFNERTGKSVRTVINADLVYNVGAGEFPLITTRKAYWKSAVAEMIGYMRGYTNAQMFADLGTPTWLANANENKAWLNNRHRLCENDMGRVYGAQMRNWIKPNGGVVDQLYKVHNHLKKGIDDRGEILQMWNVGEFDQGCLRPCMYEHQFSILDGTLYLNSTQRSCDVPLGLTFNMVQVYFLLYIMAKVTGLKAGKAYHKIVNAHIYEDQISLMEEQVQRIPFEPPEFGCINPNMNTLEDLLQWVTPDDFGISGYRHHEPIRYPFSV